MLRSILIFLVFFVFHSMPYAQGQTEIDSLLAQLNNAKRDTNRLKLLILISNKYFAIPDWNKALPICEESLQLANELKASRGQAWASENLANCQQYFGDYSNALQNYLNAIQFWETKGDYGKVADLYARIASFHKGDYGKSIEYYKTGLKYIESGGNKAAIATFLWSMSSAYIGWCKKSLSLKDSINANNSYSESINLLERALSITKAGNNADDIAFFYANLGGVYNKYSICDKDKIYDQSRLIRFDLLERAIKSYEESLRYYKLAKNKLGINSVEYEIGNYYLSKGIICERNSNLIQARVNYSAALKKYLSALKGIKVLGFPHGIANMSKSVGEAYMMLGDFKKAEPYLLQSMLGFKKINFRTGVLDCYLLLSQLYEEEHNNKKALKYYKKYSILNDSLANEASLEDRNLLLAQHDLKRKSDENYLLIKENELNEANLNRQILIRNLTLIGAFGVVLIFILGLSIVRSKRRREKAEFENQLSGVRQEALNAQMSSHFIGNTMNSINSFIQKNEKDKASEYLLLFHRVIRSVLENSFQKFVPLENDLEVLKGYFRLEQLRFKENRLLLEIDVDDVIDTENTFIPPMILQTLVENSIKHGFRKTDGGVIKVTIRKNRSQIRCTVEDNGIGRGASMLLNQDEKNDHRSYGSALAERLVATSGGIKGNTSYDVVDLVDTKGNPTGTNTSIEFPIISF